MIRLFLTLALLLPLAADATINAASFQREVALCVDGTRQARYPAGGTSCAPVTPTDAPLSVRRWDDGLTGTSDANDIDGLDDVTVTLPPRCTTESGCGYDPATYPWARTIVEAGTLEKDGATPRFMLRTENRSNYRVGKENKRRMQYQFAQGTDAEFAELPDAITGDAKPFCYGFPIRYNKGPYGDGLSWKQGLTWIIAAQMAPDPGTGPTISLYVQDRDASDKIAIYLWFAQGLTEQSPTPTPTKWYYSPGLTGVTEATRGAFLDKVYWMVFGVVNDPEDTGVGRIKFWIYDVAARKAALLIDPADLGAGRTLVADYTGRVGFAATPAHLRIKSGIYFNDRAGASYQSDNGTVSAHTVTGFADSGAALEQCREVIINSFGALP